MCVAKVFSFVSAAFGMVASFFWLWSARESEDQPSLSRRLNAVAASFSGLAAAFAAYALGESEGLLIIFVPLALMGVVAVFEALVRLWRG